LDFREVIHLPMRMTSKGQVTIPQMLRDRVGLTPGTEVAFEATDHGVLIRPARSRQEELDRRLARATGSATVAVTTDEIIRLTRGDE
jgi:AbrB family looped-hinge helix DNA binding protein